MGVAPQLRWRLIKKGSWGLVGLLNTMGKGAVRHSKMVALRISTCILISLEMKKYIHVLGGASIVVAL